MSVLPDEVDVVIVGYGPVGAAIAGLLGRYGVRTLVIDKLPDIWMAPRAIALDNEALRILQMVGLTDGAFDRVVIPHVRMRCPHFGEFARINTSGKIDDHPKLVTFLQPDLERALRDHAERQPSVTARTGVELIRFTNESDGVAVVLRVSDGTEATVRARYLVGADGASSPVRSAMGLEFQGETYGEDWLIVDAVGVPNNIDHIEFLCDPDRPTPHMVAPRGRTRWEFMLKPGETRAQMESDSTIRRLLEPWAKADEIQIERKAVYRFHARVCTRFGKGRVFLAGDAAHVTPPFAGQGLVAGLRDAANLAWKLAWVVQGRASSAILDTYDQERRPHAAKMIALSKLMGQLIMPRDHVRAVLVHGSMALLRRIPFARDYFQELRIKPHNAFAEGLFVRGGRGRPRGAWFPQSVVRSSASVEQRSDDVLGPALSVVGHGVDPARHLSERAMRAWSRVGGRTVRLDDTNEPGRCVVVRPDRTVMHDGPTADAERLVTESIALLESPKA
ncbi:MAG: bifunctional 3-(3-hydroxy-phenyl)propionate/3-hydroxycinnamic acid hydroxylase [Polyangiales bacterium]